MNKSVAQFYSDFNRLVVRSHDHHQLIEDTNRLISKHYEAHRSEILEMLSNRILDSGVKAGDGVIELHWMGQFKKGEIFYVWDISDQNESALIGPSQDEAIWNVYTNLVRVI